MVEPRSSTSTSLGSHECHFRSTSTINPDPGKLPGGAQIQQLLDGLGGWALFAALGGLLISMIVWALGSFGGNYHAVSRGKTGVHRLRVPPR